MVQQTLGFGERKYDEEFEKWWEACPKKVGKARAIILWKRIKNMDAESLEKIVSWTRTYSLDIRRRGVDHTYILHPSTILSQRRWEDEEPKKEEHPAKKEFQALIAYIRRFGQYGQAPLPVSEIGRRALTSIGGFSKLCSSNAGKVDWWERKFVMAYDLCCNDNKSVV